ncbi:nicotinate-nucleotide adenylyltransferase [Caenimonas sedimenti]|uniref:nicotinate-nucleotide adenylyltransferase n=1 Tax=Caenimonas sedimenti TaxID=2596921 RepID=UPI0032C43E34
MSGTAPRVGLFGGAFDPPHVAHVALAEAAVRQFQLDVLYVVPTGRAWHKARNLTGAEHRLTMAQLAFKPVTRAVVDEREILRPGPTYTIDTLRELARDLPGARLHLLMGEDQAASFTAWREWEDIARLAELCVARRGAQETDGVAALRALPGARVHDLQLPRMGESATDIRTKLAAGQDITRLVPAGVASYIERHRLYLTP